MGKFKAFLINKDFANSFRQITLFSGGSFMAQLIMMVYAILVARALGPNQLGIYSGLYAILGVSITFVNFGLDLWMLNEAHNYKSIRLLTGKIISIKLILGLIWGFLCLLILPLTRPQVFTPLIVLLAIGDVISNIIFNSITTSWNIQREITRINTMLLSSRIGKIFLLIGLISIDNISPMTIIGSRFVVSFLVLLISIIMMKPILNNGNIKTLLKIICRSAAFGFSEILAMIYANIDVAILSFFSISDTGIYSPASGIIHALFIIPNTIHVYLLPKYSKLLARDQNYSILDLLKRIIVIFTLIGLSLSVGLFVGGQYVVTIILGVEYFATGELLSIMSPIMLFKSLSFGLALIIIITGNQRKRLLPQLIVSVFNIVFNILLISQFGFISVAWIYTISELILMIGYFIIVYRTYNHKKGEFV
jgi:O-antigen/teichoic acid export membrane protein